MCSCNGNRRLPTCRSIYIRKAPRLTARPRLTLVDTTLTSSWDKWAQGFQTDGHGNLRTINDGKIGNAYVPNMNCPGQDPTSGFFATLQGSKMWLDTADSGGNKKPLAYNSQFKCFDGWSMQNQIVPAPYDGKYTFPSTVELDPVTGRPAGTGSLNGVATPMVGTNCSICVANPDDGTPMLPAGKYVVEAVMPPGYEIVKEEDKNILMGDIYVAPVTQQFAGLGNVFILPDQAAINAYYNANNPLNSTTNLGVVNPREDFASTDQMWPCVGKTRIVPDTMSLFPAVGQTAPFAGASRPLCDRKEVCLTDQMGVSARFYIFTKNHVAGHFVGLMTNDMASEFDPFSPQFGEKFGVPNLPVQMRDFVGNPVTRVVGDQWGAYNGLYFSSWEVNPPNPTGYAPQMSIACMNDPGPILDTDSSSPTHNQMITDPAYNPAYSNFCYETPFMPGFTSYMDTPVTPVHGIRRPLQPAGCGVSRRHTGHPTRGFQGQRFGRGRCRPLGAGHGWNRQRERDQRRHLQYGSGRRFQRWGRQRFPSDGIDASGQYQRRERSRFVSQHRDADRDVLGPNLHHQRHHLRAGEGHSADVGQQSEQQQPPCHWDQFQRQRQHGRRGLHDGAHHHVQPGSGDRDRQVEREQRDGDRAG